MNRKKHFYCNTAFCLVVSLFFIICYSSTVFATESESIKSETANTIRMAKTEGTVDVKDSTGKALAKVDNMRLNSGNVVSTESKSYAYINLDDTKALKMDSLSETEIRKSGQKLEILLNKGNLFTSVAEKLSSAETLNVRTSTMVMGIRGTDVSVQIVDSSNVIVNLFSGSAECVATDLVSNETKKVVLKPGQTGLFTVLQDNGNGNSNNELKKSLDIKISDIDKDSVLGFILKAIKENGLAPRILEESGLDFTGLTDDLINKKLEQEEADKEAANKKIQDLLNDQNNNVSEKDVWQDEASNTNRQPSRRQQTPPAQTPPATSEGDSNAKQPATPPVPMPSSSESDETGDEPVNNSQKEEQEIKPNAYKIKVGDTENGEVTVSKDEATKGESIEIKVKPDDGYKLKKLRVVNKEKDKDISYDQDREEPNKFVFKMPASKVVIKATFEKIEKEEEEEQQPVKYAIKIGSIQNGTLTASAAESEAGETITLTATPSEGFEFESIQAVKDSDSSAITLTNSGTNQYTFKMPESDVTATATFKAVIVNYNVTVGDTSGGKVTASASSATENETITLTVTPDTGYELSQLTVTDTSGNAVETNGSDGTFTFKMPSGDVTVNATFTKSQYAINITGDYSDKVSTSQTTAAYGDTVTVTAEYFAVQGEQGAGRSICFGGLNVSFDGAAQDVNCSMGEAGIMTCTFTMPAGDVNVSGDYRTGYDLIFETTRIVYADVDYEEVGQFKVYIFGQEIEGEATVCSGVPIQVVAEIDEAQTPQFSPGILSYVQGSNETTVEIQPDSGVYNFEMPEDDVIGLTVDAINNYN